VAQFFAPPLACGHGALHIKAVGGLRVQDQRKAQLDHEQWMREQVVPKLSGILEAFLDTNEEGFEVSAFGVRRTAPPGLLGLPLLDQGPIQERKEGAVLLDQRIVLQLSGKLGLVKDARRGYHSTKLLL